MSAPVGEPSDDAITSNDEIVHCRFDVWKRDEEIPPKDAISFASVLHCRIVVDVVDSHKAVDAIGIVVVQHGQIALGQCASIGLAS